MPVPRLSFEFFPPKNETQMGRFWLTLGHLLTLNPAYISMTWGALGSASQNSLDILQPLVRDCPVPVVAHLTCAGTAEPEMRALIRKLEEIGITRFLALRGDIPKLPTSSDSDQNTDTSNVFSSKNNTRCGQQQLRYASDLVSLLAERNSRKISVAAYPEVHPESPNINTDLYWLKHKLDAGADKAITQFFFDPEVFLRFRDRAEAARIDQQLVPGILPIHNIDKVSQLAKQCGATIPNSILERFKLATSMQDRHKLGVEHSVELCDRLREEGVDEFHLYTLNQHALAYDIGANILGVNVLTGRTASVGTAA